jgi:predicted ATPase
MADGITRIAVEGFKSIVKRQEIEIAPLTILAGANSSGKSSIMQPLLMLKQTLEATYDPGPLKIDGPNVKFTSSEEFLSGNEQNGQRLLRVEISAGDFTFEFRFAGLEVTEQTYRVLGSSLTLRPRMSSGEVQEAANEFGPTKPFARNKLSVTQDRFLLGIGMTDPPYPVSLVSPGTAIQGVIHVPGLRGNAERTYKAAGVGRTFPGVFDNYVASLILAWHKERNRRYEELNLDLQCVGLARNVLAHRVNDVFIELRVSLVDNRTDNIADVGFGVSQVLPVLVALRAADRGQLVYLEEPEIDLHPRAQTRLAKILADATRRGVRVVAETHSSLLLRAIQTLVARGTLDPDLVRLFWFTRNDSGVSQVSPAKLDANGAFGDWPEDFGDVALESEKQYLDAVEDRISP